MTNRIHYAYWGFTAVFCLFMTFSSLGDLTSREVSRWRIVVSVDK